MKSSKDLIPQTFHLKKAPFLPHQFYSSLKDSVFDDKDYKAVKKFYQTLNLDNLGQINKFYNFQDLLILAEIFEQRSNRLQEIFKFNPRKCNSASSFSGCVHRNKTKYLIALPTSASDSLLFERALIGGFSCVNNGLAFNSQTLLPRNNRDKYK